MKKTLVLLLSAALTISMLAGCGGSAFQPGIIRYCFGSSASVLPPSSGTKPIILYLATSSSPAICLENDTAIWRCKGHCTICPKAAGQAGTGPRSGRRIAGVDDGYTDDQTDRMQLGQRRGNNADTS